MASNVLACLKNASGSLIHKSTRALFASTSTKLTNTTQRAFSDESPPAEEPAVTEVGVEAASEEGPVYKCPEFFKYDEYSFYDIDSDMLSDRNPQPDGSMKLF